MVLRSCGIAAVLLTLAGSASAQSASATAEDQPTATSGLDVRRLPIDVGKINRGLQQSATREERNGLNLRYFISVYGSPARIDVLDPKRDNLVYGPVPYGAPTHQQMLDVMTPKEFRAPAMDFGALMRWLSDKGKSK